MAKWLNELGPESDIAISSRIRLARNIEGFTFSQYLDGNQSNQVIDLVYNALSDANGLVHNDFQLLRMKEEKGIDRISYVEKYLISPALSKNIHGGAVLINTDETISIMINEEDHIRIQSILPGLQLERTLDFANRIDDVLESNIKYAFKEELGYLTSCPTNVGTGIRASVMLHLPALSLTGYIHNVFQIAGKIGLAVRGIYGEGTQYMGNIYQISNQVTLGATEEDIVNNLQNLTMKIIQNERATREHLRATKSMEIEDRVFRAYGVLKNARLLNSNEAMALISDVKLGVNLGFIEGITIEKLNQLILMIQPGYIQKYFESDLSGIERDGKRAQLVRGNL